MLRAIRELHNELAALDMVAQLAVFVACAIQTLRDSQLKAAWGATHDGRSRSDGSDPVRS